jgi:hypothetical protein
MAGSVHADANGPAAKIERAVAAFTARRRVTTLEMALRRKPQPERYDYAVGIFVKDLGIVVRPQWGQQSPPIIGDTPLIPEPLDHLRDCADTRLIRQYPRLWLRSSSPLGDADEP